MQLMANKTLSGPEYYLIEYNKYLISFIVSNTLKDFKNAKNENYFFFAPRTFYVFFNW